MTAVLEHKLVIDKKQGKNLTLFWTGFTVYILGFILSRAEFLSYTLFQIFQIVGLVLFVGAAFYLVRANSYDTYLKVMFFIYVIWMAVVVIRGFSMNYDMIKRALFDSDQGLFLYLAPLIILFPQTVVAYKKLFDVIFICGILYVLLDMVFIRQLLNVDLSNVTSKGYVESFSGELAIQNCFLLLTYSYQTKKRKVFALGVMVLTLFFATLWGRRGLIFMSATPLVFAYILYLFHAKTKILVVFMSAIMIVIGMIYGQEFFKRDKDVFSVLLDRVDDDTRTGVEVYFYHDMETKDWLVGRGMNGEYYCPGIEEEALTDNRTVIETGYLQVILKGGIISWGLYLLILVPALILGIFYSKNILSKAAGIWIFLALIYSYPTVINVFSMQYLLVWISVGICYSKQLRRMPEEEMRGYFRNVNQFI